MTPRDLSETASWLLGRPMRAEDGVSPDECSAAETRLGRRVPAALKAFYLSAGREPRLSGAFQQFLEPDQWTAIGDRIVFLEENQGVCYWAVDDASRVWQTSDLDEPEWFEEPATLDDFLRAMLYYQMAQGGYPFCGMIGHTAFGTMQDVERLVAGMSGRAVVALSGLKIYVVGEQALLWLLSASDADGAPAAPGVFLSTLREGDYRRWAGAWQFDDL